VAVDATWCGSSAQVMGAAGGGGAADAMGAPEANNVEVNARKLRRNCLVGYPKHTHERYRLLISIGQQLWPAR